MSNIKISQLPDAEPLTGEELMPVVQALGDGTLETRKVLLARLGDLSAVRATRHEAADYVPVVIDLPVTCETLLVNAVALGSDTGGRFFRFPSASAGTAGKTVIVSGTVAAGTYSNIVISLGDWAFLNLGTPPAGQNGTFLVIFKYTKESALQNFIYRSWDKPQTQTQVAEAVSGLLKLLSSTTQILDSNVALTKGRKLLGVKNDGSQGNLVSVGDSAGARLSKWKWARRATRCA
ncbi:MAG: hypothetical protein LBK60_00425 [Verrucomicrobiales bacterium]|jgi:hypothetical protein|nr:hypothetical protein [Verrucomicrobiales bacterium]